MGTFIGSLTSAASITLTNPIIPHSFYIRTMPLTHTNISSTAVTNVAHSKLFSISFCNSRGLSSNLNSAHQHLQSSSPHALFLTETKIRPLDPNDDSILSPHLKCPGYELFSSFFPSGGVCAFIRSDIQSSRLPQFDLANPGFQLNWMKVSLPNTSKFICTLYRSPNSTNHELLFDHLSKTIDTITLHSPRSEIIILGDFNVFNPHWLTHSPHITSPAGRDAEAFAIVNDLSQLISEPTRIPDRSGDKANTLDLFLISNADIYCNPILDSPLGNSDHCLITLQYNFVSHQDRSSSSQKVFYYSKADRTLFETFLLLIPAILATLMILPLLPPSSLTQFNLVWIFLFHLPISLAKSLLQSGSIHNVQKLSSIKTTALSNGNFTKLCIQELYLYKLATYALKQSIMPKPPLSTASAIKLLYVKQDLAPSGP